ncbi:hypothetical protein Barb4_00965 [Bacteroidales bacterium Barb4]|nr:hypothetical protein Barb4_00965 [Bacteroidales bacterium Barb4]
MNAINSVTEEQKFLLCRECSLAALSIGDGLTLIRKYDFVKHGYATQAFFMLSIGIERLLKIILIYHHRKNNNNKFPDNAVLKKIGHNIKSMYDSAISIADEIGNPDIYKPLKADPIFDLIIDFLTDFARSSRYYNLDILTGNTNQTDEPLKKWDSTINKIIVERHYKHNPQKSKVTLKSAEAIDNIVNVSFYNEQGEGVNNIKDFYLEGMTVDVKQKYSMFYIYCIIRFLSNLIFYLDKNYYPFVSEYFSIFRLTDDTYIRKCKTWNIYKK